MCLLASVATFVASADLNIGTASELKSFRDAVNSGNTYSGQTIRLTADIDLAGESWTPIATKKWNGSINYFQGTFDGQGYSIKNLNCVVSVGAVGQNGDPAIAGLFAYNAGLVKNVHMQNTTVVAQVTYKGETCWTAAGSIVGLNTNGGKVYNCSVKDCNISSTSNQYINNQYSCAGGIVGAQDSDAGGVINCYISGTKSIYAANDSGWGAIWPKSVTNDIATSWGSDGNNIITDCVATATAYGDMTGGFRQARNFAAWLKNNDFPGADANAEPYTWDENGITPDKHYYFNLTDAKAEDGSYRVAAVVTSPSISSSYVRNDGIVDVYTVDYVDANNNSQTYILYPSGTNVNVQFSLEGWLNDSEDKWVDDGNGGWVLVSDKAGWFVDKVYLTQGSNSLAFNPSYELSDANDFLTTISEENRVETENVGSSNRKLRYQSISLATPSAATTLAYTTINKDNGTMTSVAEVAQSELEVYGGNGYAVVKAVDGTIIAIYDMMGRKVSDAISSGEKMTFELESGIYIINGKKVMVK